MTHRIVPSSRPVLAVAALLMVLAQPSAAQTKDRFPPPASKDGGTPRREAPTVPAAPLVAPVVHDSLTTRFVVDGVTIIQRRTNTNLVVANLYLLGGVHLVPSAQAGLEPLLLDLTERGTQRYPGDAFRRALARTGSEIGVAATDDYTVYGLRTTTDRIDSTWALYADRLLRPTLSADDFAFVRTQRVTALQQREDDPDALLEYLADSVAFAGYPYQASAVGTAGGLQALTLDQVREFHRTQMVKSRMLLVIVGGLHAPRWRHWSAPRSGRCRRGATSGGSPHRSVPARARTCTSSRVVCRPTTSSAGGAVPPPAIRTCRRCASRPRCCRAGSSPRSARAGTSRTRSRRASATAGSRRVGST